MVRFLFIYSINLFLIIFFGVIIRNYKKKYLINIYIVCIFLFLFIISAFRNYNVGTDTLGYLEIFNNISNNFQWSSIFEYSVEPIYAALNYLGSLLSDNPQIIIMLSSFIITYFIIKGIVDNSENIWLSIYMYVGLYHFYQSFNGMRQYIAIAIIFHSFKYIKERKFRFFLISVIVAMGFHYSAIIIFPFYFLYNRTVKIKRIFAFILFLLLVTVSFNYIINIIFNLFPEYAVYDGLISGSAGGVRDIVLAIFFLMFSLLIGDIRNSDENILLYFTLIYFMFSILVLFFDPNLMMRLGWYFSIFLILYVPNILERIQNAKYKLILKYIICSLIFLLHFYLLLSNFHNIVPYEFYFTI